MRKTSSLFYAAIVALAVHAYFPPTALSGDSFPEAGGNAAPSTSKVSARPLAAIKPDFSFGDQTITEDVTWSGTVLITGGLIIATQATLSIEPGTTIYFKSREQDAALLLVHGRIQSLGSQEKPVVFRSAYADGKAGDWQGIVIMASEKKNTLEHASISGAETGIEILFSKMTLKNITFASCGTGARIQDSVAVITGGEGRNCAVGINLFDAEADLRDVNYSGNQQAVVAVRSSLFVGGSTFSENAQGAVKVDGGRIRAVGNTISANGDGLSLSQCEGTVSANKLLLNKNTAVSLLNARVKVTGNDISRNEKIGLSVEDGKGVAWGNRFMANGMYDLYNGGTEDFKAMGNWWGEGLAEIESRIFGRHKDARLGRVYYQPVLKTKPPSEF